MTSNEEVLAAAERLRRFAVRSTEDAYAEKCPIYKVSGETLHRAITADRAILAEWAVIHLDTEAAREKERAEVVTVELIESLGYKNQSGHPKVKLYGLGVAGVMVCFADDWKHPKVGQSGSTSKYLKNVGQLLDLLSGLGIEPAKGGGE